MTFCSVFLKLTTSFERLGNEAADHAAKEGARMHDDFIKIQDGVAVWQKFEESIARNLLEREEAHDRIEREHF